MLNKSILVLLMLLFTNNIDAQRRSSSKDESKQNSSVSQAEDLVNQYGFSSKQELGEHLLSQDLTKTAEKTVKNYMSGEKLAGREMTRLKDLLNKHPKGSEGNVSTRSGRKSKEPSQRAARSSRSSRDESTRSSRSARSSSSSRSKESSERSSRSARSTDDTRGSDSRNDSRRMSSSKRSSKREAVDYPSDYPETLKDAEEEIMPEIEILNLNDDDSSTDEQPSSGRVQRSARTEGQGAAEGLSALENFDMVGENKWIQAGRRWMYGDDAVCAQVCLDNIWCDGFYTYVSRRGDDICIYADDVDPLRTYNGISLKSYIYVNAGLRQEFREARDEYLQKQRSFNALSHSKRTLEFLSSNHDNDAVASVSAPSSGRRLNREDTDADVPEMPDQVAEAEELIANGEVEEIIMEDDESSVEEDESMDDEGSVSSGRRASSGRKSSSARSSGRVKKESSKRASNSNIGLVGAWGNINSSYVYSKYGWTNPMNFFTNEGHGTWISNGRPIRYMRTRNVQACAKACLKIQDCDAINFSTRWGSCYLMDDVDPIWEHNWYVYSGMTSYAVRNIDEVAMEREMAQINNFMQNVDSKEAAVQASIDSYINGGGFVAEYYDAVQAVSAFRSELIEDENAELPPTQEDEGTIDDFTEELDDIIEKATDLHETAEDALSKFAFVETYANKAADLKSVATDVETALQAAKSVPGVLRRTFTIPYNMVAPVDNRMDGVVTRACAVDASLDTPENIIQKVSDVAVEVGEKLGTLGELTANGYGYLSLANDCADETRYTGIADGLRVTRVAYLDKVGSAEEVAEDVDDALDDAITKMDEIIEALDTGLDLSAFDEFLDILTPMQTGLSFINESVEISPWPVSTASIGCPAGYEEYFVGGCGKCPNGFMMTWDPVSAYFCTKSWSEQTSSTRRVEREGGSWWEGFFSFFEDIVTWSTQYFTENHDGYWVGATCPDNMSLINDPISGEPAFCASSGSFSISLADIGVELDGIASAIEDFMSLDDFMECCIDPVLQPVMDLAMDGIGLEVPDVGTAFPELGVDLPDMNTNLLAAMQDLYVELLSLSNQLQISIDYLDLNLDMLADIPCQGVQDKIAELHSSPGDDSELVEQVVTNLALRTKMGQKAQEVSDQIGVLREYVATAEGVAQDPLAWTYGEYVASRYTGCP